MKLQVVGAESIEVSDAIFSCEYNEGLIHQAVNAYRAGSRAGTKAQKNRSAVRGGGRKPWKQKGTGRARAGTIRSPIHIGGGVTFAAQPRDHSQKLNRKMYRKAISSILSELIRQDRLRVVDQIGIDEPKTKCLVNWLIENELSNVLIVTHEVDRNLKLSSMNIPHVDVCLSGEIDPYILLKFKKVCITSASLNQIEERML